MTPIMFDGGKYLAVPVVKQTICCSDCCFNPEQTGDERMANEGFPCPMRRNDDGSIQITKNDVGELMCVEGDDVIYIHDTPEDIARIVALRLGGTDG